ncbi:MAG: alpha/beta hydrolase [Paracoccus sp. BP8]|uniref:alpha/beta fold hydrolase n=1 Tax=Paracoccus pantotrophus TaxID=82367 RepID=UPI000684EC1C|nr:alpha/beta hydrolase [Paracoccus pantotrophus]RQP05418.1 MAG: alpha/beta hydrolase [Paracoccus sp. BP8]
MAGMVTQSQAASLPDILPVWESHGAAGPILLFVHGFRCDRSDWRGLAERLSPRFRCILPDLPGHGETPAAGEASMEALGAAVNRVREALGEDVILIGHSLGAKVIREARRQKPEGVAGLILIDGSLYVSDRETMLANGAAAVAGGMEPFLRGLFGRMFFTAPPAEWLEATLQRALTGDLDFARRLFLDSIEWDLRYAQATVRDIKVPAMVIQTTTFDDSFRWRPLERGETTGLIDAMRRHVPEFTAEIIEGAGHFVMQDAPAQTARLIERFATRVAARGAER